MVISNSYVSLPEGNSNAYPKISKECHSCEPTVVKQCPPRTSFFSAENNSGWGIAWLVPLGPQKRICPIFSQHQSDLAIKKSSKWGSKKLDHTHLQVVAKRTLHKLMTFIAIFRILAEPCLYRTNSSHFTNCPQHPASRGVGGDGSATALGICSMPDVMIHGFGMIWLWYTFMMFYVQICPSVEMIYVNICKLFLEMWTFSLILLK